MGRLDPESEATAGVRWRLLDWYGENQRDLPWRRSRDPYAIWVSEIMLQQTRVAVVVERYKAFMERFPTLISLALAPEQDVLALWSGLGYYRRARMLHKAAQFVASNLGGNLPTTASELRLLPGIGLTRPPRLPASPTGRAWPWWMGMWSGSVPLQGWEEAGRQAEPRCAARLRPLPPNFDPRRPGAT